MSTEEEILQLITQAEVEDPIEYVNGILRPVMRDKLDRCILDCDHCPRRKNEEAIKTLTAGDDMASVMFICEGSETPPADGDGVSVPMQDPDEWKMMLKLIKAFNINKNELFWINAVNCSIRMDLGNGEMQYRPPNGAETKNCRGILDKAIKYMQPKLIFLLGNIPYSMFKPGRVVKADAGQMFDISGIPAIPTHAPRTLVDMERSGSVNLDMYKAEFCDDIYLGFKYLQDKELSDNILLTPLED